MDKLEKLMAYWDHGMPNFNTGNVEFPFELANEIDLFVSEIRLTKRAVDPPSALVNGEPSYTVSASNYAEPDETAGN